ncbi:MAG: YraN family protein [Chthoniobacterales bacterium]
MPRWRSSDSSRKELLAALETGDSKELGCAGENFAADFLKGLNFRILRKNFKPHHGGEVDFVCRDKRGADQNALVFTEVKTRRSDAWGRPALAVNTEKQKYIIRGALEWLRLLDNPDIPFRFDIVEVLAEPEPRATLIENAFQLPDGMLY